MSRIVNRSVLLVRPKEPYFRWAASVEEDAAEHAKSLRDEFSVYLVAGDPKEEQESAPISRYYPEIFETELEKWWLDESTWPQKRTLKLFQEWFDVRAESIVRDLDTKQIESEDW